MARAVKAACAGRRRLAVLAPGEAPGANRSYASWSRFLRVKGAKDDKDTVWRIGQFLGTDRSARPEAALAIPNDLPNPDVLVIEDMGLGFRADRKMWPAALGKDGKPGSVILNTRTPFGDGALWRELIGRFRDVLTVVLPVSALRDRGAAISLPLSWDRAIEETAREFQQGVSAGDLARVRRVVVAFGDEGAAAFTRLPFDWEDPGPLLPKMRFERFLYDPERLEGDWASQRPGADWNSSAILAAALARHELDPGAFPLFLALGRGLAAMRAIHEQGGGAAQGLATAPDDAPLRSAFRPPKDREPAEPFCTAFPHSILHHPEMTDQPATHSDLLQDLTGAGEESVLSKGIEVVFYGKESALKPAPKAMFGKYFTVDREEIERINAIRNLIVTYLDNPKDRRPLSFAVFGPPGSGKSFAVKELAEAVAKDRAESLEFNLSQFGPVDDLHRAFQTVRNGAAQEKIPFVFWDEFDAEKLRWLKEFLAPMQDAVFFSGGANFSFGKAVFVFAGGTSASFEEFNRTGRYDVNFEKMKGPDFVSRLRGFIDIKGPNQAIAPPRDGGPEERPDRAYVIRRALMLRRAIEKHASHLLSPDTKRAAISPNLVRAFLRARKYAHGARSLESLVSMSDLARTSYFGPARLPSEELMRMHVSEDFLELYGGAQLKAEDIEYLAEACHDAYRKQRRAEDVPETGEMMRKFAKLKEGTRESNRQSVRAALVHLAYRGYQLCPYRRGGARFTLPDEDRGEFSYNEHDRWLREKLLEGWTFAKKKSGDLRLNPDIKKFDNLLEGEKYFDGLPVATVLRELPKLGYGLERARPKI